MQKPDIAIIVAIDKNRGIGLNGQMPWHLSADLKRFKKLTMGHPVIMGRRTFESLPNGALPGRTNIVITSDKNFKKENTIVVRTPEEALEQCEGLPKVFIIGGGTVYKHFLPVADLLYLTVIDHVFSADTVFPEYLIDDYKICEKEEYKADDLFPYNYEYILLKKRGRN